MRQPEYPRADSLIQRVLDGQDPLGLLEQTQPNPTILRQALNLRPPRGRPAPVPTKEHIERQVGAPVKEIWVPEQAGDRYAIRFETPLNSSDKKNLFEHLVSIGHVPYNVERDHVNVLYVGTQFEWGGFRCGELYVVTGQPKMIRQIIGWYQVTLCIYMLENQRIHDIHANWLREHVRNGTLEKIDRRGPDVRGQLRMPW